MTGSTQPMMPTTPRKIAMVMIRMSIILLIHIYYLIPPFIRIILEVDVAPGIDELVILGVEGFFVEVP